MWKEEELGGFILNFFPNWKKIKELLVQLII
jgi:hypothetical protein